MNVSDTNQPVGQLLENVVPPVLSTNLIPVVTATHETNQAINPPFLLLFY